jgi:parallel beta-helix repeat protein
LNTGSGIKLKNSSNNNIRNNIVHTNGGAGIYLCLSWGAEPVDVGSSYNIITSNIIYSNDWAGIELAEESSNNHIYNNNVFNNSNGIDLDFSFNNTLKNNTVTANRYNGICFDDSDGNTISNNSVFDNHGDGIDLEGSFDNMLINNTVYLHTDKGIKLKNSSNNNIRNNIIYSNGDAGIHLCRPWGAEPTVKGSSYNTITSNIIYSNDGCGIILKENSSNNHIYHNNLIYNDEQAYDDSSNNTWDNGPIIGGNYWGDHECTGNPSNGSQPYYIDSDSTDHYPFGDPIGELPPLPPPVPRTDVYVDKTECLHTSDTYINYNQTYNFDIEWYAGVWGTKNLDNVTITLTTLIDIAYTDIWALYNNGSDTTFILPFNHTGENYTWVLPLKDRFASDIEFYLPNKTVQDNPWADMVVNTMDEDGYTRVNVTVIPRTPSLSVDLTINGKIIDFSYPSEFEVSEFFPDYYITFYGEWEDLNQDQSYNFSVLVDEPKEVGLWLDKTHGQWDTEYSNTVTLPVSELGSVTVSYEVPVKWEHEATQPQHTQSITIALEAKKSVDTGEGTYPSIRGTHNGTIELSDNITITKLYTYPCAGTGGHTESLELEENGIPIANGTWNGYKSDRHNLTIHNVTGASYVTLLKGHKYNYTLVTGSYPQIIHQQNHTTSDDSIITCTEFIDANGKKYSDWIPAIRLE